MNCSNRKPATLPRTRPYDGARWLAMLAAVCLLSVGCQPEAQIETYTVVVLEEPTDAAPSPQSPPPAGESADRMLAAIVPHGERAWFFKVVGPIAAVDRQAKPIFDFFATIRLTEGESQPGWKLPDGWTEQAGTGIRAATISIPAEGKPLELSVIALPWTGGAADVLNNVNRWRGQLQLPAVDEAGLAECTREVNNDGTRVTIVDLAGRMQDTGMSGPFAGGPFSGGAATANQPAASPPFAASQSSPLPQSPPSAAAAMPQFKAPDDWQPAPATPPRKAAYSITQGDKQALVTVIDFSAAAGPMIADPLQNLNRWRREVGLSEIAAAELPQHMESFELAGLPVKFFAVLPAESDSTESQITRGTLAAMVTHGSQIWFFKLAGDRSLVEAQRGPFRAFVDSVRFPTNESAGDGD